MQDEQLVSGVRLFFRKHSFFIFISISMLITFTIAVISMTLYNSSGTAQLDLSRPGYKDIRSQIDVNPSEFEEYPASGPMNSDVISKFKSLYEKHSIKIKSVDAFGGDPLGPDELGISPTDQ